MHTYYVVRVLMIILHKKIETKEYFNKIHSSIDPHVNEVTEKAKRFH